MPNRKSLDENEMAIADQVRATEMSIVKIKLQLKRSEKVIRAYLNDPREYRRV